MSSVSHGPDGAGPSRNSRPREVIGFIKKHPRPAHLTVRRLFRARCSTDRRRPRRRGLRAGSVVGASLAKTAPALGFCRLHRAGLADPPTVVPPCGKTPKTPKAVGDRWAIVVDEAATGNSEEPYFRFLDVSSGQGITVPESDVAEARSAFVRRVCRPRNDSVIPLRLFYFAFKMSPTERTAQRSVPTHRGST